MADRIIARIDVSEDMHQIVNEKLVSQIQELKQHLFELSFALDCQSCAKDYAALRDTHYDNMNWIIDNGLWDEYYKRFFKMQFGEVEDGDKN